MSASSVLWLVIIAIIVCIALSWKLNVNLGISAIIFSYIIGCFMMQMKVKDVVALWPTKIAFQLMTITMFFAFAKQNGCMEKIAKNMIYAFRKQTWMLPIVIFFAGFIIGALGAPGATANIIMAVIAFDIGKQLDFNPVAMGVVACNGGAAGSQLPWSAQGVIAHGVLETYYPEMADAWTWKMWFAYFMFSFIMCVICCFVLGAFKKRALLEIEKPEPLNREQKMNLVIISGVVGLAIIIPLMKTFGIGGAVIKSIAGYIDIQMICVIGTLLCILLKLGDQKKAIVNGVPWNTIVMLGGMAMLLGVAQEAGATDMIAAALSTNVSSILIIPLFGVFAGLLSFFVGGMSVVYPMLSALVPAVSASAGISALGALNAIVVGARITAMSPFSTGGALIIGAYTEPDEKKARYLFNGMLVMALISLVATFACGLLGLFG